MDQQQYKEYPKTSSSDSTVYAVFGIISLILGIVSFLFSFIPCLGFYALIPGVIALSLGIAGLVLASKAEGEKGMLIAGVIISSVGIGIAIWQYRNLHETVKNFGKAVRENRHRYDDLPDRIDTATLKSDLDTFDFKR